MENINNKLLLRDKNTLNFIEKGIEKLEEILKYNNNEQTKEKRRPRR